MPRLDFFKQLYLETYNITEASWFVNAVSGCLQTDADACLSTHEKQERFSSHLSVKAIFLHHHPVPEKVCVEKRDTQSHVIWNEQNATELPGFGVILSLGSLSVREKLECFL